MSKTNRGAKPNNKNALKHGIYCADAIKTRKIELEEIRRMEVITKDLVNIINGKGGQ